MSLCAQPVGAGDPVMVPSGQMITLSEVLLDEAPGELWARFRFVAPQIDSATGNISYDQAGPDMDFLCTTLALPYLRDHALTPAMVVISLMEFVVPFGTQDPEATQFFEAYRPEADGCIWEAL